MAKIIPFPVRTHTAEGRTPQSFTSTAQPSALLPSILVVPVHNEEDQLERFLTAWRQQTPTLPMILVLDRCTDQSLSVARSFLEGLPKDESHFLQVQELLFNPYGKAGACLFGLWSVLRLQLPFDYPVIFWDSDNEYQIDADLLQRMMESIRTQGGMATASRSGTRLLRSRLAHWATQTTLRLASRSPDMPEDILTAVHGMQLGHLLMALNGARSFDMETRMVRYALVHKMPIQEFSVQYHPRTKGKKIRAWHLFGILLAAVGLR